MHAELRTYLVPDASSNIFQYLTAFSLYVSLHLGLYGHTYTHSNITMRHALELETQVKLILVPKFQTFVAHCFSASISRRQRQLFACPSPICSRDWPCSQNRQRIPRENNKCRQLGAQEESENHEPNLNQKTCLETQLPREKGLDHYKNNGKVLLYTMFACSHNMLEIIRTIFLSNFRTLKYFGVNHHIN